MGLSSHHGGDLDLDQGYLHQSHALSGTPLHAEYAMHTVERLKAKKGSERAHSGQGQPLGIVVVGRKEGLIKEGFLEEAIEYCIL